jgi:hypothetical protein
MSNNAALPDTKDTLPGLPDSIQVSSLEGLEQFAKLPIRAAQIGALLACGFRPTDIDQAFSLPENTACAYKHTYFDKHSVVLTPAIRDKIVAAFFRRQSLQLVSSITPTVINQAGLGERVKSASLLMDRAIKLEQPDQAQDIGKQISNALSKLASSNPAHPPTPKHVTHE